MNERVVCLQLISFCRLVAALDGRDDDVEPGRLWRFAEPQIAFGRTVETGYCGLQQVRLPFKSLLSPRVRPDMKLGAKFEFH